MIKTYTEIFILQENEQNIFKKLLEIFFYKYHEHTSFVCEK